MEIILGFITLIIIPVVVAKIQKHFNLKTEREYNAWNDFRSRFIKVDNYLTNWLFNYELHEEHIHKDVQDIDIKNNLYETADNVSKEIDNLFTAFQEMGPYINKLKKSKFKKVSEDENVNKDTLEDLRGTFNLIKCHLNELLSELNQSFKDPNYNDNVSYRMRKLMTANIRPYTKLPYKEKLKSFLDKKVC